MFDKIFLLSLFQMFCTRSPVTLQLRDRLLIYWMLLDSWKSFLFLSKSLLIESTRGLHIPISVNFREHGFYSSNPPNCPDTEWWSPPRILRPDSKCSSDLISTKLRCPPKSTSCNRPAFATPRAITKHTMAAHGWFWHSNIVYYAYRYRQIVRGSISICTQIIQY